MSRHRELDTGDILPAGWLDALQEFVSTGMFNFLLAKATADPATAVKLTTAAGGVPGTGNDQVSVAIMGQWRYRRTPTTAAVPGGLAVGTHHIFVTAPVLNEAAEDAGTFNYDFALELRAAGTFPATALYRKVGEFVWDGAKITLVTVDAAAILASDARLVTNPVSGTEELREIRGRVNADGTVAGGTGFTITRTGAGIYRINFTPVFAAPASTTVTSGFGGIVPTFAHLNGDGDATLQSIRVCDVTGANVDAPFQFNTIGPR